MTSQTSCSGWRDPSSVFAGPTIISLSSYYSPAGSTSLVVVLGANFYSYSIVRFGTFTPTVYFINSGQLQFYVPSSLFPGTYPVQVFNGAVGSNIVNYTIDNSSGYWILNPNGSITNSNVNGLAVDGIVGQTLAGGVGNYQYGDVDSLASITSGISNIAIGKGSAPDITTGNYNVAIGQEALMALTTGSQNVCIGTATMRESAVGVNNTTAVGQGACRFVINGRNVGLGVQAIGGSGSANAFECTGIGTFALQENGGNQNSALGCNAGYYPSGSYNTYLGYGSGQPNTDINTYNYMTCVGSGSGGSVGDPLGNSRILLGRSNQDTVYLNKIAPMYTSIPTFTSANIGGIIPVSTTTVQTNVANGNIATFLSVPLGVYLCTCSMYSQLVSGNPNGTVVVATSATAGTGILQSVTVDFWTSAGILYTNLFPTIPFTNSTANITIYVNFALPSGFATIQPYSFFLTRIA